MQEFSFRVSFLPGDYLRRLLEIGVRQASKVVICIWLYTILLHMICYPYLQDTSIEPLHDVHTIYAYNSKYPSNVTPGN